MHRRALLKVGIPAGVGVAVAKPILANADDNTNDDMDQATLNTVMAFMGAMGGGDMETMASLMAEDIVWQNGGDADVPWIGPWVGNEEIFAFLGTFWRNVEVLLWENEDVLASDDTVAIYGRMNLLMTASGQETGEFTFSLRAKVRDRQVVLWNWLENSYAISQAFHGR